MRKPVEREFDKNDILKKCFKCIMDLGLENASIRNFSHYCNISSAGLYYWFKDKNEIVMDSIEYGLSLIVDKSLKFSLQNLDNIMSGNMEFINALKEYSEYLRVIVQVITSPVYGKLVKENTERFTKVFEKCSNELADKLNSERNRINTIVDISLAVIIDCVIWDKWDSLQKNIEFVIRK